jgi:hypothetical protein
VLLACWVGVVTDHGRAPRPLSTSAVLASSTSTSTEAIHVHTSLVGVDTSRELMLLEFRVRHQGRPVSHCSSPAGHLLHLAVGTGTPATAAPAALLPLCSAQPGSSSVSVASDSAEVEVYHVAVPLRHTADSLPQPFDALLADVKLELRPCGATTPPAAAATTQQQRRRQHSRLRAHEGSSGAQTAAAVEACSSSASSLPAVHWTGVWTSLDMALAVSREQQPGQQQHSPAASLVAAALAAGDDDDGERSDALLASLGLGPGPSPAAVVRLHLTRSPWLRVVHLTSALLQAAALMWCVLLVAGRLLAAYVLHRLLCSGTRAHGGGGGGTVVAAGGPSLW